MSPKSIVAGALLAFSLCAHAQQADAFPWAGVKKALIKELGNQARDATAVGYQLDGAGRATVVLFIARRGTFRVPVLQLVTDDGSKRWFMLMDERDKAPIPIE